MGCRYRDDIFDNGCLVQLGFVWGPGPHSPVCCRRVVFGGGFSRREAVEQQAQQK